MYEPVDPVEQRGAHVRVVLVEVGQSLQAAVFDDSGMLCGPQALSGMLHSLSQPLQSWKYSGWLKGTSEE